jgi:hypothetical protein
MQNLNLRGNPKYVTDQVGRIKHKNSPPTLRNGLSNQGQPHVMRRVSKRT